MRFNLKNVDFFKIVVHTLFTTLCIWLFEISTYISQQLLGIFGLFKTFLYVEQYLNQKEFNPNVNF